MLKRMLACLFIVAALPLLASTAYNHSAAPFASVAFAGHSLIGGSFCTCGCPDCGCDPGEPIMSCGQGGPMRAAPGKDANQDGSPTGKSSTAQLDFGTGALMLALAFFVWARISRA